MGWSTLRKASERNRENYRCRYIVHDHALNWGHGFTLPRALHVSIWTWVSPVSTLITPEAHSTALSSCTNESAPPCRRIGLRSSTPTRPGASWAWTYYSSGARGSCCGCFRCCSSPATTPTSPLSPCLSSLSWNRLWLWSLSTWSVFPPKKYTNMEKSRPTLYTNNTIMVIWVRATLIDKIHHIYRLSLSELHSIYK